MKRVFQEFFKLSLFDLLILFIISSSFFLRAYQIDLRPFHHDEGVNYHFLRELIRKGYYPYSHENYHGPLYFYFAELIRQIYGNTELAIRLPSILAGTILVSLPYFLFKTKNTLFVALSAVLLALSPSLVFHSRYAIHEMLFVTLSIWFACAVFHWIDKKEANSLYQAAIALALLITTKETFIVTGFAVCVGIFFAFKPKQIWSAFVHSKRSFGVAIVAATILLIGIFSGGFRWIDGIFEMFRAVPQWIGRNSSDTGHFKPFLYYSKVMLKTEPWLVFSLVIFVVIAVFAVTKSIYKRQFVLPKILQDPFVRFIFGWSIAIFVVYGFIKYKTVWLIINQTAPLTLLTAGLLAFLIQSKKIVSLLSSILAVLLIFWSAANTYRYNYAFPYGKEHPFCYVHTSQGLVRLLQDINFYRQKFPKSKILIGINTYWPLPYYVRDYEKYVSYQKTPIAETASRNFDILILDKTETWQNPDWARKYYRLSDVQESFTYFKFHH